MGYCRVVGITIPVNTYSDIYRSLVSHIVVLIAAVESCGLIHVCYWSHANGVDQSMVGKGMLVGDAQQRTAECSCDWKWLSVGPVAASSRSVAVLGMAGQCYVARYRAVWSCGQTVL